MLERLMNAFRPPHDPTLEALGISREYQQAAARQGYRFAHYAGDFVSLELLTGGTTAILRASDAYAAYEGWIAAEQAAEAAKGPQPRIYTAPLGPATNIGGV